MQEMVKLESVMDISNTYNCICGNIFFVDYLFISTLADKTTYSAVLTFPTSMIVTRTNNYVTFLNLQCLHLSYHTTFIYYLLCYIYTTYITVLFPLPHLAVVYNLI